MLTILKNFFILMFWFIVISGVMIGFKLKSCMDEIETPSATTTAPVDSGGVSEQPKMPQPQQPRSVTPTLTKPSHTPSSRTRHHNN